MGPRLQRAAHDAVIKNTERLDRVVRRPARKGNEAEHVQAALVALDAHSGEVLAMIGGRNYDGRQVNHATHARRQTRPNLKPVRYSPALGECHYTTGFLPFDLTQSLPFFTGR